LAVSCTLPRRLSILPQLPMGPADGTAAPEAPAGRALAANVLQFI
jgi:hypothetical protein